MLWSNKRNFQINTPVHPTAADHKMLEENNFTPWYLSCSGSHIHHTLGQDDGQWSYHLTGHLLFYIPTNSFTSIGNLMRNLVNSLTGSFYSSSYCCCCCCIRTTFYRRGPIVICFLFQNDWISNFAAAVNESNEQQIHSVVKKRRKKSNGIENELQQRCGGYK